MGKRVAAVWPMGKSQLMIWFAGGETRVFDTETPKSVTVLNKGAGIAFADGLGVPADELYEMSVPVDLVLHETGRLVGEAARARREQGISQARVAAAAGIKQPVVARLETGINLPRLDTMLKVLGPLGKTLTVVDLR